jgi:hypothetical protein
MPLYTFLHNLLNVLVQIANKMGLQKKTAVAVETCLPPRRQAVDVSSAFITTAFRSHGTILIQFLKHSHVLYEMHTRSERKASCLSSTAIAYVRMCSFLFGRFRMSDLAFT